jgi:hypothetical protein
MEGGGGGGDRLSARSEWRCTACTGLLRIPSSLIPDLSPLQAGSGTIFVYSPPSPRLEAREKTERNE